MSKTTIATPAPCTDSRCREAAHTGTDVMHVIEEIKTERWEVSVFRIDDPEVSDLGFHLWVAIEDALRDDEAAEFVRELTRLSELCRLANLLGAWEAEA